MKRQYKIKEFWAAYSATLWAGIFALLHLAWAFGWYIGLDKTAASAAFERKWFLIYDIIAAVLCGLAATIVLAIVRTWERRFLRLAVGALGWCCAGVLALRGGAAVVGAIAAVGKSPAVLSFWDLWFCLGAVLFAASLWRFKHGSRKNSM